MWFEILCLVCLLGCQDEITLLSSFNSSWCLNIHSRHSVSIQIIYLLHLLSKQWGEVHRIRQPNPTSNMKLYPRAGSIVLSVPERTIRVSFFFSSWRPSSQSRHSVLIQKIYHLSLLTKQSGEVESDNPTLLPLWSLCLEQRVYCPYQVGLPNQTNLTHYLKTNNLSTLIIDQAMKRSRIR